MIPRIAKRGSSFKGAGQYYLHDKEKSTKERVAWTHTHNLPTSDPELAMKWMAHTAIHRNKLKQQAGIPPTGRKGNDKPVYSFSLAWQPEQEPQKEHMLELAFDALALLGLKDHEAVFVAHNDTAHPHVHVITNLVHPENGKTMRPQNDRLKFSAWAEAYEKEHGKIYCEERVINNERRRNGEKIKHREVKIDQALIIQNLYNQSDNGKAFQEALEKAGFTLAKGDRRGFVLVDKDGNISSLSRQLKGQRAKDLKQHLGDLTDLPNGKNLSEERQYFLRDQYEIDRQKGIVDAAIEEDENRKKEGRKSDTKSPEIKSPKSFAEELDAKRKTEAEQTEKSLKKERQIRAFYEREKYVSKLEELKQKLAKAKGDKERTALQKQLAGLQKTLSDLDQRMREQGVSPEPNETRDFTQTPSKEQDNISSKPTQDQEIKKRDEEREKLRKQMKRKGMDRGDDFDLSL